MVTVCIMPVYYNEYLKQVWTMFKYFNPSALVLSFIQSIYWAGNKFKYSFWHDRMGGFVLCVKQHNSVVNALNRTLYNIARHLKAWFPKLDPDVKWTRPNFTCWFAFREDIFIGIFFFWKCSIYGFKHYRNGRP